CQQHNRYPITF
nr:immunoglobulin light chain junction region [Macaca mulatta]MOV64850.1 immunoglobulin light chain junction region [Macaca mulatta]MOV65119.1 immunoglobulin light chain junction region [Macaca mulatta]